MKVKIKTKEALVGYLFALPSLLGFAIFFLYPFGISIYLSLTSGVGGKVFVGLANYIELIQSGTFQIAAWNTTRFTVLSVPLVMLFSLLLAILLNSKLKHARIYRSFFILPLVIPIASVILMWQLLFADQGVINQFLQMMGAEPIRFLNGSASFFVLMIIYIWKNSGYNIVLFLAGLNGVDPVLYEAASLDGATKRDSLFHITIPMLAPTLFFVFIMSIINSFKVFREAYLLAGNYPHDSIYMLQHYMNNNFYKLNYQHISTAAILFFLVVAVLVLVLFQMENRSSQDRY